MKRLLTQLDCCCCLIVFFSIVRGLPLQESSGTEFSRAANLNGTDVGNVCVQGDQTYAAGQNFSTSNPCETCTCDPPGVSCSLSSCDLKPGCKAIHKANKCCPDYVCECERNGKIYGNGEKVEEPNPCRVCYCKGGEIKCALVTCYTRDDCEPGYVAGVCCPKYDHCPPLEIMKNKSTTPAPAQVIISDLKTDSTPTKHNNLRKTVTEETTASESTETLSWTTNSSTEITTTEPSVTETAWEKSTFETTETTEELNITTDAAEKYEIYATTDYTTLITEDYTTEVTTEENSGEGSSTEEPFPSTRASEENTEMSTTGESLTTEEISSTTTYETTEHDLKLDEFRETVSTTVSNYPTDESSPQHESTTETESINATTETDFKFEILENVDEESESTVRNEVTTESSTEKPNKSVIKVIVPKTMKKDLDLVQKTADGPGPIVVMISADQIQFLKLAEEPPVYVENRETENLRVTQDYIGVVVVPKTTPTTVEMVKVVDGTSVSDVNVTTEISVPAHGVNTTFSANSTEVIQER